MQALLTIEDRTPEDGPENAYKLRLHHVHFLHTSVALMNYMRVGAVHTNPDIDFAVLETRIGLRDASLLAGLLLGDIPHLLQHNTLTSLLSPTSIERHIATRFHLEDLLSLPENGGLSPANYNAVLQLYTSLMDLIDTLPRPS